MVNILYNNKNRLKEYNNEMQEYSIYYKDKAYEEDMNFFAPNDLIALLEVYYDVVDFNLSASEARHVWKMDKNAFLEEIDKDFGYLPEIDEVREEIRNLKDLKGIQYIKNLDNDEILFKR